MFEVTQFEHHGAVEIDRARDALLTDFGKATLKDRYLMPGEENQDLFARVASYYGDDAAHAQPCMTIYHACGLCRRRLFCQMVVQIVVCLSLVSLMRPKII